MFWSVVRAHHSDIGGATHGAYNPAATEIWHEGLRIPPMRLTENGVLREDLLEMLALNVRHPRDFRGDLAAQIGAARAGRATPDRGDRRVRRGRRWPTPSRRCSTPRSVTRAPSSRPGPMAFMTARPCWTTTASTRTNIVIRAHVTKQGSDVTVDLSESDPQVTGFINSSHRQHAVRRGDGLRLPARSRHRQERGRVPAAEGRAQGGHHRLGARGRAGDDVHQPLLQRDHRGDHRRPGPGLSRSARWAAGDAGCASR